MDEKQIVDEVIKELYQRLSKPKKRLFLIGLEGSNETFKLKKYYDIVIGKDGIPGYDMIFLTHLSISMLSHLATGCTDSLKEEEIILALLKGIPVVILEEGIEYRKFKDTAYKPLYNLYKDYEKKLETYGIRIIQDVSVLMKDENKETSKVNITLKEERKKVLLEKDLVEMNMEYGDSITISKNTIITPLANDYIKSQRIHIIIK